MLYLYFQEVAAHPAAVGEPVIVCRQQPVRFPRHLLQLSGNFFKKKFPLTLLFQKPLFLLKTVAFIAGKKNPATQKFFICFSIKNLIANISLFALSWPELNFGRYRTFEIIF